MTIRNLEFLLKPRSVALVGASKRASSVGAVIARNLFMSGFDGPIMPVHPQHSSIQGVLTFKSVADLPIVPDLAVIATPPASVPTLIEEFGAKGTKAAVIITAGFTDSQHDGPRLRQAMLDAARPHLLRIVGPNCLGIQVPSIGLNAGFAHIAPLPGRLAFVAQSGAVVTSVLDWATSRGIGFSHLVALGDKADVDFGDMLDYLANDPATRAILLYVEAITDARKFMSAGRAASRMKPVIVVKAGRHPEGARAAASHTGALAGTDAVYDTAFRRAGMLRVIQLEELFDAVQTLAMFSLPKGDRLAIVTNGGGLGVLATDSLMDYGGQLADLAESTVEALDRDMPATWSRCNPVDIIGDAPPERYEQAIRAIKDDPGVDAIMAINCPTAVTSPTDAAQAVLRALDGANAPPVFTTWLGEGAAQEARRAFAAKGIPSFDTPNDAARAFMQLVSYRRNQETLMETPPSWRDDIAPDFSKAQQVIRATLDSGRSWLREPEAKAVLAAYHIPVVPTRLAYSPEEAAAAAGEIGKATALKIISDDILHKSDVGGVALDLRSPAEVEKAARAMLDRVQAALPEAVVIGFGVQPMIHRPKAHELIVGVITDPAFGPCLLFGQGGTAVEVIDDKALALPPLNLRLADEVMAQTRIYRLLKGYRDRQAADLRAVAISLIKVSQLAIDHPEIDELDINPLFADESGVLALDVRIKVSPASGSGSSRLAIRPYPKELEEDVTLKDGRTVVLRPVRPEDEPSFHRGFATLTPDEVRLRFFAPIKVLSHVMAARFTQIDYDREMAFVLATKAVAGEADLFAVARIVADPDNERAEYAIIVHHDYAGQGLGALLMDRIIAHARRRGIGEIFGDVLRENKPMLSLCAKLGFVAHPTEDPGVVRMSLAL